MDRGRHFTSKIREHRKGISPIIATLLLILIAIAAGVVVYAYVIGFVGTTTGQGTLPTSESLTINEWTYNSSSSTLTVFVQNTGKSTINVTQAYLLSTSGAVVSENLTLGTGAAGSGYLISPTQTVSVVASGITGVSSNAYYQVKVITANGTPATSQEQLE